MSAESYESDSNMLLVETLSPGSSATETPSSGFSGYSREEHSESVHSECVVNSEVYNSVANEYQQVSYIKVNLWI